MKLFKVITLLLVILTLPGLSRGAEIPSGMYQLDKSHASLVFNVSHIGFSNYTASFDDFDAELKLDFENPEKSSIKAAINPYSLDLPSPPTGFKDDLLGEKWLNAEKFKQITFSSTKIEKSGKNTAKIFGELELLGIKKSIILNATYNGGYAGHPPMDPNARIGFSATTTFKRSDFNILYGLPKPGTNMGVGDSINVQIEAEFSGPPLKDTKVNSK